MTYPFSQQDLKGLAERPELWRLIATREETRLAVLIALKGNEDAKV